MEVINAGIRKVIKGMCVVAQTAQFVSLMPQPKDFVTRIVGDVVYLSAQVSKLSEKMNKLLDDYANIPTNYLVTQMNSITGSLSRINDRLNVYTQNAVNQTIGLGENTVNMITDITGNVIDITGSVTNAVVSLGSAVAETSTNLLGQTDTAEDIHDSTEVILEWTSGKFKEVKDVNLEPMRKMSQKLTDAKTGLTDKIGSTSSKISDKIEEQSSRVKNLITELKEKMEKLSNLVDTNFKDVTGLTSVSKGASVITESLSETGVKTRTELVVNEVSGSLANVIKNFSIGKMAFAFAGVLTQSAIVRLGLDQLPPIDFESMLCKIRDDISLTPEDLAKQYNDLSENTYREMIALGEELATIPSEDRNYSEKNYDEFVKEYEEELKEQRDKIRTLMKFNRNENGKVDVLAKREIKTAIKEIEKYRKKVKNAKQADTFKTIIGKELDNFKKEAEYRCNSLKSDWQSAMDQYRKAIAEIKQFFTNGGSCDMFINDCCDKINQDFNDIKELCTSLGSQLIASTIKVVMPADVGPVFPNPVYKISDFLMDIKTIIKFLKDLIEKIMDIINNVNKIARLMLNGINSLKEIVQQLLEIVGLKWLMDLVQTIIDLLSSNISNAKLKLENTLSPVYFSDTQEYENTLEALQDLIEEDAKITDNQKTTMGSIVDMLNTIYKSHNDDDIKDLIGDFNNIRTGGNFDSESIEKIMDNLEKQEDIIVAYKSPIIKELTDDDTKVSNIVDGGSFDSDLKFVGWYFFHPDLVHTGKTYYVGLLASLMRKIKSKIIKRAAKNGHKKRGGVNLLKRKLVGTKLTKIDTAYTAFYWYTYYTEDLEKDCYESTAVDNSTIIDNIVHTENGSVVEITDANGQKRKVFVANSMVRSGDYVTVDGVKYRVN